MSERITRWSPDTCGCKVDYAWDDALPDDQITLKCVRLDPCDDHVDLLKLPLGEAMEAVLAHNRASQDQK